MKELKFTERLFNIIFPESDLKETSLTLISIGSAVGIGIGLLVSRLWGSSYLFAILFLVIGFISLKKNWYLLKV